MSNYKKYKTVNCLQSTSENQDLSSCIDCKDTEQRRKILNENKIVCIDLYANWCQPCKAVAPLFNELAKEYNIPGKCLLIKENVDFRLTTDYMIHSIPCFIFYINGQLLKDHNGDTVDVVGVDIKKVKNILDQLLANY